MSTESTPIPCQGDRDRGGRRRRLRGAPLAGVGLLVALAASACFVKPNDYDGDKRADVVFITNGTTSGTGTTGVWTRDGVATPLWTGPATGVWVGGDYDNDGKWEPAELQGRDWISSKLPSPIHYDPPGLPTAVPDYPTGGSTSGPSIVPVPADYDGDGDTDPAYYAQSDGSWWISGRVGSTTFGIPPVHTGALDWDVPVPGDYDGDLKADLAVFRPTDSTFHILQSKTSTERVVQVGTRRGNLPVPADYDGNGTVDPAVSDPTGHLWWLTPGASTPDATMAGPVGFRDSYPVVADYDGDGKADPATYDPTSGVIKARLGGIDTQLATLPLQAIVPALPYAVAVNIVRLTFYDKCMLGALSYSTSPPIPNWRRCPPRPTPSDYTGDHQADPAYLQWPAGIWRQLGVADPLFTGLSDDTPVPGDYDGDGKWEPAVVRGTSWISSRLGQPVVYAPPMTPGPAPQAWYWKAFGHHDIAILPVPGDYDGDHRTDPAYYDEVDGTWWISTKPSPVQFGIPPVDDGTMTYDVPVPADYNGDGTTDPAIYRPSDSTFHIRLSTGEPEWVRTVGLPGDIPVPADYNGDGWADPATYRLATQQWFIEGNGSPVVVPGVPATDLTTGSHIQDPAPADYDGDGDVEPAVVDETTGAWNVLGRGLIGTTGLTSSASFNLVLPIAVELNIARLTTVYQCVNGGIANPRCPSNP